MRNFPGGSASRQRGVALAIALVVLLILTIIGVSALVSTALEGMMAGNIQEQNRALQAAETGIDVAFTTGDAYKITQTKTGSASSSFKANAKASYAYTNTFTTYTKPPRSQAQQYSATHFSAAHFQTVSVGTANIGANVTLTQGLYQITPKAE
jgi:Tfp pilus assembly protein PilX